MSTRNVKLDSKNVLLLFHNQMSEISHISFILSLNATNLKLYVTLDEFFLFFFAPLRLLTNNVELGPNVIYDQLRSFEGETNSLFSKLNLILFVDSLNY